MSEPRSDEPEPPTDAPPTPGTGELPNGSDVVAIPEPDGNRTFGHLVDGRPVPDQTDDRSPG